MNDRFKFRVWDEDCNKYLDSGIGFSNSLMSLTCINGQIIEQCIGIRDKSGKPIYEGDILYDEDMNEYYSVVWVQMDYHASCCFTVSHSCDRFSEAITYAVDESDYEVVGNIHENMDIINNHKSIDSGGML